MTGFHSGYLENGFYTADRLINPTFMRIYQRLRSQELSNPTDFEAPKLVLEYTPRHGESLLDQRHDVSMPPDRSSEFIKCLRIIRSIGKVTDQSAKVIGG